MDLHSTPRDEADPHPRRVAIVGEAFTLGIAGAAIAERMPFTEVFLFEARSTSGRGSTSVIESGASLLAGLERWVSRRRSHWRSPTPESLATSEGTVRLRECLTDMSVVIRVDGGSLFREAPELSAIPRMWVEYADQPRGFRPGEATVWGGLAASSFRVWSLPRGRSNPALVASGNVAVDSRAAEHALKLVRIAAAHIAHAVADGASDDASIGPSAGDIEPVRLSARSAIRYIARTLRHAARGLQAAVAGQEQRWEWSVVLARGEWPNESVHAKTNLRGTAGRELADPFLLATSSMVHLFSEEIDREWGRGRIVVHRLEESGPRFLGTALEEDFHLSFPFVFAHGGRLFMCPETSEIDQVRIYQCDQLPLRWSLAAIALDGVRAVDTVIWPMSGSWWLLTSTDRRGVGVFDALELFESSDPVNGPWTSHPGNPVVTDVDRLRSGGLFRLGDRWIRVAQRSGVSGYGEAIRLYSIDRADREQYHESPLVLPNPGRGERGSHVHHMSIGGGWTAWDQRMLARVRQGRGSNGRAA